MHTMDDVLKINGIFICFSTFVLYSMYLYPVTSSWNLILFIIFCYITFFVYDINQDIVFKRVTLKENPETSKESEAGEDSWEVV